MVRYMVLGACSLHCEGRKAHAVEGPQAEAVRHAAPQAAHLRSAVQPGVRQLEVAATPVIALQAVLGDGVPVVARGLPLHRDGVRGG